MAALIACSPFALSLVLPLVWWVEGTDGPYLAFIALCLVVTALPALRLVVGCTAGPGGVRIRRLCWPPQAVTAVRSALLCTELAMMGRAAGDLLVLRRADGRAVVGLSGDQFPPDDLVRFAAALSVPVDHRDNVTAADLGADRRALPLHLRSPIGYGLAATGVLVVLITIGQLWAHPPQ